MQSWQTKAQEWEMSALTHLDGFVRDHALWFLIGVIYLMLALLVWVLSGGLRRKGNSTAYHVRPLSFTRRHRRHQRRSIPFPRCGTRQNTIMTSIGIKPASGGAELRATSSPRRRSPPRNGLAGLILRRCRLPAVKVDGPMP